MLSELVICFESDDTVFVPLYAVPTLWLMEVLARRMLYQYRDGNDETKLTSQTPIRSIRDE